MRSFLIFILILTSVATIAQDAEKSYYMAPVDIPMFLTGNFGELRSNHFHSGIDIKTQGKTGLPVYAAADGYVSRINISPYGFGHAIYIAHPNGTTTVYGHLQTFSEKILKIAREKQYMDESFSINIFPGTNKISVKKGEQIALSGNTGGSGGTLTFRNQGHKNPGTSESLKIQI